MKYINEFLASLIKKARGLREDAGHSGSMSDNGANALEEKVLAYSAGMTGTIPAIWINEYNAFVKQHEAEADPEYAEFRRLQKKFGKVYNGR